MSFFARGIVHGLEGGETRVRGWGGHQVQRGGSKIKITWSIEELTRHGRMLEMQQPTSREWQEHKWPYKYDEQWGNWRRGQTYCKLKKGKLYLVCYLNRYLHLHRYLYLYIYIDTNTIATSPTSLLFVITESITRILNLSYYLSFLYFYR